MEVRNAIYILYGVCRVMILNRPYSGLERVRDALKTSRLRYHVTLDDQMVHEYHNHETWSTV